MPNWKEILQEAVDTLESALGNPTGDMSAVTQGDATALAAYLVNFRELSRAHNQARICLIVPDLANLASDLPNTAIKTELEKIATVSVLDQTGVDGGQEDWDFYDLVVVGSDTYLAFTNGNIDDLILLKVPVMVCNSAVADHLKMGTDTTQSANTVNEWCKSIHNRVMYLIFGSTGDKALFSEATVSDRLDMSDPSLTEQLLMTSLTGDDNTTAVVCWLPVDDGSGTIGKLNDDTDLPACRLFTGCFIGADKLTDLGKGLLRRIARNMAQAGISPALTLKASAALVAAILNDTADMQPKLGTPAADISADILAVKGVVDAITAAGPTNAQLNTAIALCAQIADGWDAALATILDHFSQARIENLDQLDFDLQGVLTAIAEYIDAEVAAILLQTGTNGVVINSRTAAFEKLAGVAQIKATTEDLEQAAGAKDLVTGTDQDVIVESLVLRCPVDCSDDAGTFSGISIQTDDTTAQEFVTQANGVKASLTQDAQLSWTGAVLLKVGKKIQLTIYDGPADDPTVCDIVIKYRAVASGGYLA